MLGDVGELWRLSVPNGELLSAAARSLTYGTFFKDAVKARFRARYGRSFASDEPTYNAGIFVANLAAWRQKDILKEIFYWMVGV